MKSKEIKAEIAALEKKSIEIAKAIFEKKKLLYTAMADELIFNHSGIAKGDKVTLYKKGNMIGTGFFIGHIEKWGSIRCVVAKEKKDGTPSMNDWNNYDFDRIEKIDQ